MFWPDLNLLLNLNLKPTAGIIKRLSYDSLSSSDILPWIFPLCAPPSCSLPGILWIPRPKRPAPDSACASGRLFHPFGRIGFYSVPDRSQNRPCTGGAARLR